MSIKFKIIDYGTAEYHASIALREEILRKPLGLTFRPNELAREKNHTHIAGYQGKKLVATAVLVPKGKACKVQRVAVKSNLQNSGIGQQLMAYCEMHAISKGFQSIYCHARRSAVNFYLKNHYIAVGKYFKEDSIPHLKMKKQLVLKISKSTAKDRDSVIKKLVDFNRNVLGFPSSTPSSKLLNYHIKIDGKLVAGINSIIYFKDSILFINQLFVVEKYRGLGLGNSLLRQVEKEAKAYGAKLAHLDTFDWQAKDFYIKHGYKVFGMLEDCPQDHKRYYMKKKL
jgi:predicted GNAT family N-acyltransferase